MDPRPIGVMDSGLGGISVLRTLVKELPDESFFYLGDTQNAPYGDRSEAEILELTRNCVGKLVDMGVKAVCIACNTATSAAEEALRAALPIPVVGIEPALKPAALAGRPGKILVMATAATIRQEKFQRLNARYGENALLLPCPGLMEFVERLELETPALNAHLDKLLAPFRGEPITSIVLGCTHYPFLNKAISRRFPHAVLYEGGMITTLKLKEKLAERDALGPGPGSVKFFTTGSEGTAAMEQLFALPDSDF